MEFASVKAFLRLYQEPRNQRTHRHDQRNGQHHNEICNRFLFHGKSTSFFLLGIYKNILTRVF